jgi:tryptophanyl-tRNA synthetase
MSLNDPTSKMSKSHKSEKSRILITDSTEDIKAKISSAKTDSIPGITYDQAKRPGISNLLDILSIFDPKGRKGAELAEQYSDINPKQLKDMVTDAVVEGLGGIRDRYLGLLSKGDEYLDSVQSIGAQKAQKSADDTMQIVRDAVGL